MFTSSQIRRNSALVAPSKLSFSTPKTVLVNTCFAVPLLSALAFSVSGNHKRISFITGLLKSRRPSNIARLVIPVFVRKTVERMSRRWFSAYDCKKLIKRVEQKLNAPATVLVIVRAAWAVTATFCPCIGRVFGRGFATAPISVRDRPFSNPINHYASAGTGRMLCFTGQIAAGNYCDISTRTQAQPLSMSPFVLPNELQNNQFADTKTEQIKNSPVNCKIFGKGFRIVVRHIASNIGDFVRLGSVLSHRVGPFPFYQNKTQGATI